MVIVVLSALLALLWATGSLITDLLFPQARRRTFLAFASGLSLLHLLTLTGIPLTLVLAILTAAAVAGMAWRLRRGWRPRLPTGRDRLVMLGLGAACLPLWAYFMVRPLWGFDARNLWFFQARILFANGRFPFSVWPDLLCHPGPIFALCPHAEYPKLVPILAAHAASLFGFWNEYLPKVSLVALEIVELAALVELGWRIRSILLVALMTVLSSYRYFFDSASLDIHVGLLTLAAILALGRDITAGAASSPPEPGGDDDRLIGIAALALLTQLKVEGRVIVAVVLLSLTVVRAASWARLRRVWRAGLLFAPALLWLIEARLLSVRSYFEQGGILSTATHRLRTEYFAQLLPGIVTQTPVWSGAVIFVLAAVAVRFVAPTLPLREAMRDPAVRLGLLSAGGLFLAQSAAYLASPYRSAYDHLTSTAYRTTLSMQAALIAAAACLLELAARRRRSRPAFE